MFHRHELNSKRNRLHERCLLVTYEDHKVSFEEHLDIDNNVLAMNYVNMFSGISLDIVKDVFPLNTPSKDNIRSRSTFYSRPVNSVYNGTESDLADYRLADLD